MVERLTEQDITDIKDATGNEADEDLVIVSLQPKNAMRGISLDDADKFWTTQAAHIGDLVRHIYGDTRHTVHISEDVTMHKFIIGNSTIGYSYGFRGLVTPQSRHGIYTTALSIKEPALRFDAAKSLLTALLKDHLFIYSEEGHTAYHAHGGNPVSFDQDTLSSFGIDVADICQYTDQDGFSTWEYINLRRPHSGVPLFPQRQYEC